MNAIILSGGSSRRMGGVAKAFLRLGSETFIERILRVLTPLFDSLIIATNAPNLHAHLRVPILGDLRDGMGPLMGLCTGLTASSSALNFVTTADAPLVNVAVVRYLIENAVGCDGLVPRSAKGIEPLCAVYSRTCIPAIEKALPEGRIVSFFPSVNIRFVRESVIARLDPDGLSFLNVNTPEDYENLMKVHALQSPG